VQAGAEVLDGSVLDNNTGGAGVLVALVVLSFWCWIIILVVLRCWLAGGGVEVLVVLVVLSSWWC